MKKLKLITIGLLLHFAFAGCSDSNNTLSPAGEGEALSKASAQQTVRVQVQPTGGAIQWQLQAKLTSSGNGQFSGSGKFEIPVLGGVIFIPILGVMQMEQNSSRGVAIHLRMQGQEKGAGRVQLRFRGTGPWDPETRTATGTGSVRGIYLQPDLNVNLDGPASFFTNFDNR